MAEINWKVLYQTAEAYFRYKLKLGYNEDIGEKRDLIDDLKQEAMLATFKYLSNNEVTEKQQKIILLRQAYWAYSNYFRSSYWNNDQKHKISLDAAIDDEDDVVNKIEINTALNKSYNEGLTNLLIEEHYLQNKAKENNKNKTGKRGKDKKPRAIYKATHNIFNTEIIGDIETISKELGFSKSSIHKKVTNCYGRKSTKTRRKDLRHKGLDNYTIIRIK